jgi:hypothetical protein
MGIEPTRPAWKAGALPLSYTRLAPRVGFEPTTLRLTAACSTIELSRKKRSWQRHTLPDLKSSTICAEGLNCRVRDGNGCFPFAIVTRTILSKVHKEHQIFKSSPRSISTGQLNTLLYLHFQPIYLVIYQGPYFS